MLNTSLQIPCFPNTVLSQYCPFAKCLFPKYRSLGLWYLALLALSQLFLPLLCFLILLLHYRAIIVCLHLQLIITTILSLLLFLLLFLLLLLYFPFAFAPLLSRLLYYCLAIYMHANSTAYSAHASSIRFI